MSARRAAAALRVIAFSELILAGWMIIISVLRDSLVPGLRDAPRELSILGGELALYARLSFAGQVTISAVILVALALFSSALGRRRGLALLALAAMLGHLVLAAINRALPPISEISLSVRLLWWPTRALAVLALMLPLVATARALPSRLSKLAASGAVAFMLIDSAISLYGLLLEQFPAELTWVERGVAVAGAAWFAAFALPLAGRIERRVVQTEGARSADAGDGTALRVLAWALLARVGLVSALQVMLWLSMAQGEHARAASLTTFGTLLGVITTSVVMGALVAHARSPSSHGARSIPVAIVLLLIVVAFDVAATNATNELVRLTGAGAMSFWSMPSAASIEGLEAMRAWGGRGALAFGVAAGLAIASSLLQTAQAVGTAAHQQQARLVMKLLVGGGLGSLAASFLMGHRELTGVLLLSTLALFVVGIALLVSWMRLLLGLARVLEIPPQQH